MTTKWRHPDQNKFSSGCVTCIISYWLWIKWFLRCFGNPVDDLRIAKRGFKQSKVNKRYNKTRGNLKIGDINDQTSLLKTLRRFHTFYKCLNCCWIWKNISFLGKQCSLYNNFFTIKYQLFLVKQFLVEENRRNLKKLFSHARQIEQFAATL